MISGNEKTRNSTPVGRNDDTSSGIETIGAARLRFNGQFDTDFGFDGQITINGNACCRAGGKFSEADSVLIQHDGKTVIGASVIETNYEKIILRLESNGTGDATFGTEGQLAGSRLYPDAIPGESAESGTLIAFTAGEKILAAAYGVNGGGTDTYVTLLRVDNDLIFTADFDPLPAPVPM